MKENVIVDGLLIYDRDVGFGDFIGFNFIWFCYDLEVNIFLINKCFYLFVMEVNVIIFVNVDISWFEVGEIYVMRLIVFKNERSFFIEMFFEIVNGKIFYIVLR